MSPYKANTGIAGKKNAGPGQTKKNAGIRELLFGSPRKKRKSADGAGSGPRYFGIILAAVVLFFLMSFTAGIVAYKKTVDGISLEARAASSLERETVWIDAKPDPAVSSGQALPEDDAAENAETAAVNADGEPYYDVPLSDGRQDAVLHFCGEYGVPAELVYGIMSVGSGYREDLISETGDYGIMQINENNFSWLTNSIGATDFLDFGQNVHCGIYMLSGYYHKYGDYRQTAMCYRYGEGSAKQMWSEGIYETDYTEKIIAAVAAINKR